MYYYPILYFYFLDLQTLLSLIPLSQTQGDIFRILLWLYSIKNTCLKALFACLFILGFDVRCSGDDFIPTPWISWREDHPVVDTVPVQISSTSYPGRGGESHCAELTMSSGSFSNFIFNSRLSRYVGCSDMCVKGFIWCAKILILNIVLWAIFLKVSNQKL